MNVLSSSLYPVVRFTLSCPWQSLPIYVLSACRLARRKITFACLFTFCRVSLHFHRGQSQGAYFSRDFVID